MEGAKKEDVQESTNQEKVQDSTNQEKAHDSTNQEKAHDSTNEKPTAAQNSDDSNKPKESPAKGKIDKPEIVTFANISRASIEIKDLIKCTPCTVSIIISLSFQYQSFRFQNAMGQDLLINNTYCFRKPVSTMRFLQDFGNSLEFCQIFFTSVRFNILH